MAGNTSRQGQEDQEERQVSTQGLGELPSSPRGETMSLAGVEIVPRNPQTTDGQGSAATPAITWWSPVTPPQRQPP